MDDTISHPGLIAALLLPWFMGVVFTRALLFHSGRWNWFIIIGQGYFVGILATTVLLRLSDWAGAGLHFWGLATTMALLGFIGVIIQLQLRGPNRQPAASQPIPYWQTVVVALLLVLLAWRYMTILEELLLRPLYAWDAWMNWAPKAIVWFHQGHLVEFVRPELWLQQSPDLPRYTLGNAYASHYPPAVPLILLWSMMGAGTWDHSHLFLPWFLAACNLGLALYGHLRLNGNSALTATLACYLLLSMPFLNVHTALVGYADFWVAAAFGLAVFALREWHLNRSWSYGLLLVLMALFCTQLKKPGIVLAAILIAVMLRSIINTDRKKELVTAAGLTALVAALFWFGLDVNIPLVGRLALRTDLIVIPGLAQYGMDVQSVWGIILESMFLMINWHILWYLLAAFLLIASFRKGLFRPIAPDALAVTGSMIFITSVFLLRQNAEVQSIITTLNRALLYPIPALIFCLFRYSQKEQSLDADQN